MRKFRFNLQRVLDYRQTIEDKLLAELADVRAQHEREVVKLAQMVCDRDSFCQQMKEQLAKGDLEDIKQAYEYMNELIRCVKHQDLAVRRSQERKERKTAEVLEATRDRKVLERLRDYKLMRYKHDVQVDEQKFLDDIACIRHNRAKAVEDSKDGG